MNAHSTDLTELHRLRLTNVLRIMRPRVPEDQRAQFDRYVAQMDQCIDGLFAIDWDVASIITIHLLDEHDIVVKKAACDALASIADEAKLVLTMAASMADGYPLTSAERKRLRRAEYQVREALEIARQ